MESARRALKALKYGTAKERAADAVSAKKKAARIKDIKAAKKKKIYDKAMGK